MEDNSFIEEMPNGSIRVTLDEDRWYVRNGKALPSVTWILNEGWPMGYGYKRWLANMPSFEEAEVAYGKAGERGSKVHAGIELLLKGESVLHGDLMFGFRESFTVKEWMLLHYFRAWYDHYGPEVIAIETDAWNGEVGYAGTIDLLCDIDERILLDDDKARDDTVRVVIDWKTSSGIYDTHLMQIASYAKCFTDGEVDYAAILRLGSRHKKRYEFRVLDREQIEYYYGLFLHARAVWQHVTGGGEPKYAEVTGEIKL